MLMFLLMGWGLLVGKPADYLPSFPSIQAVRVIQATQARGCSMVDRFQLGPVWQQCRDKATYGQRSSGIVNPIP